MLNPGGAHNDENHYNHHPGAADRMRIISDLPGDQAGHVSVWGAKMRGRIREPSSWGSLGAILMGVGIVDPVNMPVFWAGVVCCVAGILLRERK